MKKALFILISIIGLALYSCESNILPDTKIKTSGRHMIPAEDTLLQDSAKFVSESFDSIAAHPLLFGTNVVIFNSVDEMYAELDSMNNCDYMDLRTWQATHNLYNPILNSIIIHDSVLIAAYATNGFPYSDTINLSEEDEDKVFATYDHDMTYNYHTYVRESQDAQGHTILSPLGRMDDRIFTNEKNLYICGGVVYKFLTDGILSCPYNEYAPYASCTTIAAVQQEQTTNGKDNAGTQTYPDVYHNRTENFPAKTDKYEMIISTHLRATYPLWGAWESWHVITEITNYRYKNNGDKRTYKMSTQIDARITSSCPRYTWTATINKDRKIANRQYTRQESFKMCGCNELEFKEISMKASNSGGCCINETRK